MRFGSEPNESERTSLRPALREKDVLRSRNWLEVGAPEAELPVSRSRSLPILAASRVAPGAASVAALQPPLSAGTLASAASSGSGRTQWRWSGCQVQHQRSK